MTNARDLPPLSIDEMRRIARAVERWERKALLAAQRRNYLAQLGKAPWPPPPAEVIPIAPYLAARRNNDVDV